MGCLPEGSGVPVDQCMTSQGESCTCSNGMSGELSCEGGQLYCVCGVFGEDMASVMPDMVTPAGDLGEPDSGVDMTDGPRDMGEDMGGEELCGGVPCTCETGALPQGWSAQGIGDAMTAGDAGSHDGEWCMDASGQDIFGMEDSFGFVFRDVSGDVDVVARVDEFGGTDPWSKIGVMIREDMTSGSRYAATLTTANNGSMLFHRAEASGETLQTQWTEGVAFSGPLWLRITRRGDVFEGASSSDGMSWTTLGTSVTIDGFGASAKVGLAMTSHDNATAVKAKFSQVEVIQK